MSLPYSLQYYHSFKGNDTFLSTYICPLQEGGILVVQAVQSGVEFIIHKDNNQKIINLPNFNDQLISCIGITGVTIEKKEIIILLLKSKEKAISKGRICQIEAHMIDSTPNLIADDLNICTTRIGVSFIPTYMKAISVKHTRETDPGHFIFLGNAYGTTTVFDFYVNGNGSSLRLSRSHFFTDFFPKAQSYLVSMDFLEVNENRRFWAFGFANGLVCVYSISLCRFENKSNLKTKVIEYDPIDDTPIKNENDIQKVIIASHLSSPVYCVKLIKTAQEQENEPFTIDFLATSYDDKLVVYHNIVNEYLRKPMCFCDVSNVSCINCMSINDTHLILGDVANLIHIYSKQDDNDQFIMKTSIGVNDCVYFVQLIQNNLIVSTRLGVYIFSLYIYYCLFN